MAPVTKAGRALPQHQGLSLVSTGAWPTSRPKDLQLPDGGECWITVHPSFLLRIPEADRKREEKRLFLRDLKRIKARAAELTE
jgi:hypothetical protein